ncbi:site-specific integrase [Rhabdobacter roseus]
MLKEPAATTPTLIYLLYRFGGQRLKYSTGEKIIPSEWDEESQRARVTQKDRNLRQLYKDINNQLDRYEGKVKELRRDFDLTGIPLSTEVFKEHLDKEFKEGARPKKKSTENQESLFQFVTRYIEECRDGKRLISRKNRKYNPNSLKHHTTTLHNLEEFQRFTGRGINFSNIDVAFHRSFVEWLTNEKKYAQNTIGNQIKNLKSWLTAAHKEGLHQNRAHEGEEFNKPSEETASVYLNDKELDLIYHLSLSENKRLDKVRDLFLIGCYTGLRFSDFSQLKPENITHGGRILSVTTQKTGSRVFVPMTPKVTAILEKHSFDPPRAMSNQKMNDYLKELAKLAGLTERVEVTITKAGRRITKYVEKFKLISTHTARRSFATNAYLAGVPTIDIMKITGHKTETAFMKYIKVSGEETAIRMLEHDHFRQSSITIAG